MAEEALLTTRFGEGARGRVGAETPILPDADPVAGVIVQVKVMFVYPLGKPAVKVPFTGRNAGRLSVGAGRGSGRVGGSGGGGGAHVGVP